MSVNQEIQSMKDRLIALEVKQEDFWQRTVDYRTALCDKIDKLQSGMEGLSNKITDLPCKERKNLPSQIKALWTFISAVALLMLGGFVSHIWGK